jgi:UrcA family protein
MIRIVCFVSALAIAAGAFATAQAAGFDGFTVPSAVVNLTDLNLNNPKEARLGLIRIERAASRVCSMGLSRPTSSQKVLERACAEEATIRAVDSAHSLILSAALAGRLETLARR